MFLCAYIFVFHFCAASCIINDDDDDEFDDDDNRSFQRRVFPGNHLHWYWQLKTNRRKYTKTQTNWP